MYSQFAFNIHNRASGVIKINVHFSLEYRNLFIRNHRRYNDTLV